MALFIKAAALFAVVTAAAPAVPQTVAPQEQIPLVMCPIDENHGTAGSAFRVSPNLLLSVKHVTNGSNCEIDGQRIHIVYTSPKADFSILSDDRAGGWLKVDCNGFVAGRKYLIIGHARGLPGLVVVPAIATGETDDGLALLVGIFEAQPGQSGGPVIDAETGKVVGTTNQAEWEDGATFSVALKDTPVCGSNLA